MRRLLALVFALLILVSPAAMSEEDQLTEEETQMLIDLLAERDEEGRAFVVLPENFQMPATGLKGEYRLLILGIDQPGDSLKGRSDTMILAVLNTRKNSLKLVSFMRDLYVKISGGGHNRLNAAYAFGGETKLRKTLEENFGIAADGYLAVNYSLMAELVDAIGGVELTVDEYELKPLNGTLGYYNYQRGIPENEGMLAASGTRILTGLQAMSYARIRKTDSDFERVGRQQQVIQAIYRQIQHASAEQIIDAISGFIGSVGTDVSLGDALSLLKDIIRLDQLDIQTLSIPVKGAFSSQVIRDTYYLVPNLKRNREALMEFLTDDPTPLEVDKQP